MDMQTIWVDRGNAFEFRNSDGDDERATLVALSRGGGVSVLTPAATFWIVLRGCVEVECRDGRFRLRRGEWLSLDRESRPSLHADHRAVVVGVLLPHPGQVEMYPGRGMARPFERLAVLSLWRRTGAFSRNRFQSCEAGERQSMRLSRYLSALQHAYRELVFQCPGRSLRRKRQVFSRMQRARLFLEGNLGRTVRVSELADLSNVSIWYFTKTFHALYGEGPQAASSRIRLLHAAQMLLETRLSVTEVGVACGFENNCSFSRAFRMQFGAPPSLYRMRRGDRARDANTATMDRQATAG